MAHLARILASISGVSASEISGPDDIMFDIEDGLYDGLLLAMMRDNKYANMTPLDIKCHLAEHIYGLIVQSNATNKKVSRIHPVLSKVSFVAASVALKSIRYKKTITLISTVLIILTR